MNAATHCKEINTHAVCLVRREGPVFYAALPCEPCATEALKGISTNRAGQKHRLVSILWDHLVALDSPLCKHFQSSDKDAFAIQVVHDPLGKPHLWFGEYRGPAISFSECGGKVWAAICIDKADIGIDVAGADEFQGDYPFHRVFQEEELQNALSLTDGDMGNAAALLWSVKEAVVKALGSAFHLVNPLQIGVYQPTACEGGYTFSVSLSGKALRRFPLSAETLLVCSLPLEKMCLSIAILDRRLTGNE